MELFSGRKSKALRLKFHKNISYKLQAVSSQLEAYGLWLF